MDALVGPPDREGLPPELRDLLDRLPDLPHFALLAHAESAFVPRLEYGRVLMRELSLSDDLREAVIVRVAAWARCDYVRVQHEEQGARAGLSPDQLAAAASGETGRLADEDQRAAVDFVSEMLQGPGASPAAVRRLVERVGERGLVEVGLVVERYLGLSLLLASLRVPAAPAADLIDVRPPPRA